jgi:hypothetical protein
MSKVSKGRRLVNRVLEDSGVMPSRDPDQQERRIARQLGGRVQPGSGSGSVHKSDVKVEDRFLIEAKQTVTGSFRVTPALVELTNDRAREVGLDPVLSVEFTALTDPLAPREWVMIPYRVFMGLVEHTGEES